MARKDFDTVQRRVWFSLVERSHTNPILYEFDDSYVTLYFQIESHCVVHYHNVDIMNRIYVTFKKQKQQLSVNDYVTLW